MGLGVSLCVTVSCLQGMDAVTRQTGQHIEFEPEWEGAFNLQLKLADNLAIIQDWCGTDVRHCSILSDNIDTDIMLVLTLM